MRAHPLETLKGALVVSCQAYPGEPMRDPHVMAAVAAAVAAGGAAGIRAQGIEDLVAITHVVDLPLIGLVKKGVDGVFITPTLSDCAAVAAAGADIVALDGTTRPRPDGSTLAECIAEIHHRGRLAMADCATVQDAVASAEAGADCIGTTLAGYTPDRVTTVGPDFALLSELVAALPIPILAEGRIRNPDDAAHALALGAHAVVVGTAITHPTSITALFVAALSR